LPAANSSIPSFREKGARDREVTGIKLRDLDLVLTNSSTLFI